MPIDQQENNKESISGNETSSNSEREEQTKPTRKGKKRKQTSELSREVIFDSDDDEKDALIFEEMNHKRKVAPESGLTKVVQVSQELQEIIGEAQLPRTEAVKRLHQYCAENKLRDPIDGRFILCDEPLQRICHGLKRVHSIEIMKFISPHLGGQPLKQEVIEMVRKAPAVFQIPPSNSTLANRPVRSTSKLARQVTKKSVKKVKIDSVQSAKPRRNGLMKLLQLSPQIKEVIGQHEQLARPTIIKELWVYIKDNKLQDPKDGRYILCDEKLQKLFGLKRVSSFQMAKLIGPHCWDAEDVVEQKVQ